MVKLIITEVKNHPDGNAVHAEAIVQVDGVNEHVYTFDDIKQARAFMAGFQCAKQIINGLVQSLPLSYERK